MTATRLLTRTVSVLLALALLVGSVIAIVEMVLAAAGRDYWLVPYTEWAAWLSSRNWAEPVVRAILIGAVIVGLLLLFLAIRRGKPATLPLRQRTPGVNVNASRRSVQRSLSAAASRTLGVSNANASVRRRTARIDAQAAPLAGSRTDADLRRDIEAAVQARLDALGLARELRLDVHLQHKDRR